MITKTKQDEALVAKIREAVLDMMSRVTFDKDSHTYTRVSDGAWLQGVSTVSSIYPKDWLAAWGSKEAVKFLGYSDYADDTINAEKMLAAIKSYELETYLTLLQEAKGAAFRKSKDALLDGTTGHEWLEQYVKAQIRGEKTPEIPTGMLERPIKQFIKWAEGNVDYWILSEARVANPEKGYAGTLDGLAMMKTGKLAIIDFKFASHISADYYLQCAGYQATFEPYGIKIDERIIIRLPKTLEMDVWNKKEHKYEKKPNNIEIHKVATKYELDRDVFFGCLPLKKWINSVKSLGI